MPVYFNDLTPPQLERLTVLFEECGEVIQIIGKIMRHGLDSKHPEDTKTNRQLLEKELGHVANAIQMLDDRGDISRMNIDAEQLLKATSILPYLHHHRP